MFHFGVDLLNPGSRRSCNPGQWWLKFPGLVQYPGRLKFGHHAALGIKHFHNHLDGQGHRRRVPHHLVRPDLGVATQFSRSRGSGKLLGHERCVLADSGAIGRHVVPRRCMAHMGWWRNRLRSTRKYCCRGYSSSNDSAGRRCRDDPVGQRTYLKRRHADDESGRCAGNCQRAGHRIGPERHRDHQRQTCACMDGACNYRYSRRASRQPIILEEMLPPVSALSGNDYLIVRPGNPSGSPTGARHYVKTRRHCRRYVNHDGSLDDSCSTAASVNAGQSVQFEVFTGWISICIRASLSSSAACSWRVRRRQALEKTVIHHSRLRFQPIRAAASWTSSLQRLLLRFLPK